MAEAHGAERDRADEVTEAFFDALEAAADNVKCNGAELVAGIAYVLATLATTAKFEGAPEIVASAFHEVGLQLPEPN